MRLAILDNTEDALPPRYRLDSLVAHLAHQQNRRILIGVVESWAQQETPTPRARLAQGRALLELGMCDSAWARIQEQTEGEDATVELLLLTAEIFMARRWPKQAREILERAQKMAPNESSVRQMLDALAEPQTVPEPCDYDDPHQLTLAAHHCLATGAMIRGQNLLTQIVESFPEEQRARDMLWAIDGDFTLQGTLNEAMSRYGPDLGALADLADDPDLTDTATQIDIVPVPERDVPFPDLFRDLGQQTEVYSPENEFTDEITHVSSMADLPPANDPSEQTDAEEQTQIRHVILKDPPDEGAPSPVPSKSVFSSDFELPETEDADVVRMTRPGDTEEQPRGPQSDLASLDAEITLTDPRAQGMEMQSESDWVKPPAEPSPHAGGSSESATASPLNIIGVIATTALFTAVCVLLVFWFLMG